MAERRSERKRGFNGSNQSKSCYARGQGKTHPKRGGPAVLLSCETGLERRCLRDGLDILTHYYKRMYTPSSDRNAPRDDEKLLTIEQEIQLLKDGNSVDSVLDAQKCSEEGHPHQHFQWYESGCKGTVLVMFCPHELQNNTKKQKVTTQWDPIQTVSTILQNLKFPDSSAEQPSPRSRYVVRMIPLQLTCFTSMEEIQTNLTTLIQTFLLPQGLEAYHRRQTDMTLRLPTFKVEFRRRHCSNIHRNSIIDSVILTLTKLLQEGDHPHKDPNTIVNQYFKVDLEKPDYTIILEICRNICGMSVVKQAHELQNFNLIEAGMPPV